jgi:hypothetical protein
VRLLKLGNYIYPNPIPYIMSDYSWKAFSQTPAKLLMFGIILYDEVSKAEIAPP